ncbi:galactose-1-phosphate uridylyltransferase [Tenggerimyces flavus]|uniref:Galactose-1-phosphate uridylyltransferase n=1 Tax=Tenggerimyces flavus TaxID=1708749 RepID=A0ABV7Y3B8_9ACTN|nr:galactose-1-phosphate uridylyltransferase [Tenggerimyces flavus]MBM7790870.1 UDPglucose--hexose-1-phosphate uridylyltransferase [Tenggerimyces flavus]
MKRTSTRLADGRELIYFDERDDTVRDAPDTRDLPERAKGAELRYDALTDDWVAVASHRLTRTFLPPADQCPLCPSKPGRPSEIPAESYDVVVFENRFPSFSTDADLHSDPVADPFGRRAGVGRCEVVCFTSDHNTAFANLTEDRVRTVMAAWVDRTLELNDTDGVEQVFCFENRGEEIGVTLHHPHGQIYAYPYVTPRTTQMLASVAKYKDGTGGRNLFEDLVEGERNAKVRVVAETDHWVAFVPDAARWPVEVNLAPLRRVPDLPSLTEEERDDFGPLYLRILNGLDRYFDKTLPYIAAWHQAPVRTGREDFGAYLQVYSVRRAPDKLKYLAGSESGMGAWVNDIAPETIAARLREVL